MRYDNLIRQRNIKYFGRYYRLILFSVVVAVAVIVGSLVVGDSVRATLRGIVEERLGQNRSVIFSRQSMIEDAVLHNPIMAQAEGYLMLEGFLSYEGRMIPVTVWGSDNVEQCVINQPLAEELGGVPSEELVLRLPATGMVPSGSLFVTENYTTSLRVAVAGVIGADEGGNMNLRNEQTRPLSLFVPRHILAETMELEGKINLILCKDIISQEQWQEVWQPQYSGLNVAATDSGQEVISSRIFLQQQVVEAIVRDNERVNRVYSYLANDIISRHDTIPYSFVTAMDRYRDIELSHDEAILSDYSARRLNVKVGDKVEVSYFVAGQMKNLSVKSCYLTVRAILPIEELKADKSLSAEFPGLSDVESCTEWESDLPIDMDRISTEDEDYWYSYRQTPKAIIPYQLIAQDWASDYGVATALRVESADRVNLSSLRSEMFGVDLFHPQEEAMYGANNGVDFAGLFLALGFFVVAAALMLMYVPLWEMYSEREREIVTLATIGYSVQRIKRQLLLEALPVVFVGCLIGVVVGVIYTGAILWLLEGVWQGATHTAAFHIHIRMLTVILGLVASVVLVLLVLVVAVGQALGDVARLAQYDKETRNVKGRKDSLLWVVLATIAAIGIYLYSFIASGSVLLFVLAGLLAMLAMIGWVDWSIGHQHRSALGKQTLSAKRLYFAQLYMQRSRNALSLLTLAFGVFIVFVVGLNRRTFDDGSKLLGATGGYSLWCQTSVPLQHDPSTHEGRTELSIAKEWDSAADVLSCLRYSADDASCLNLNKVSTPTVLGVDLESFGESDFAFADNIYGLDDRRALMRELARPLGKDTYPAVIDATSLLWSLMKEMGDTLRYKSHDGREVNIVPAATLSGSVFQGNILLDKSLFSEVWPEHNGCNIFLVKTEQPKQMKNYISQTLYEYGTLVTPTTKRLEEFNEVTDTYLSIFMTLGSIGLLLGLLSFVIVVRKNLTRSRADIAHYLLLGFAPSHVAEILYRENIFVPRVAIVVGVIGAIIGVGHQIVAVGFGVWLGAVVITFALWMVADIFIRNEIRKTIKR